ncbi:MAG: hypothetical protein WKG07_14310 [Hymenobacter sp.]
MQCARFLRRPELAAPAMAALAAQMRAAGLAARCGGRPGDGRRGGRLRAGPAARRARHFLPSAMRAARWCCGAASRWPPVSG